MKVDKKIACSSFSCADANHRCYVVPGINIKPEDVSVMLISEAAPADPGDYYYTKGNPLFAKTTIQAFRDAGSNALSIREILGLGVYLTTAVKCGKTGYGISTRTIKECSLLLEREVDLFPNVKAYLLMGDVGVKAINYIAQRAGEGRVIPSGSTYKIRGAAFSWREARVFPSYLQAGPSFFIEKSKRTMIAQDIAAALALSAAGIASGIQGKPKC